MFVGIKLPWAHRSSICRSSASDSKRFGRWEGHWSSLDSRTFQRGWWMIGPLPPASSTCVELSLLLWCACLGQCTRGVESNPRILLIKWVKSEYQTHTSFRIFNQMQMNDSNHEFSDGTINNIANNNINNIANRSFAFHWLFND